MNRILVCTSSAKWALGAGGFAVLVAATGCLPSPDTSVLPPYDGGAGGGSSSGGDGSTSFLDGGLADATLSTGGDSGPTQGDDGSSLADSEAGSSSSGTGSINGFVVDYAQGAGVGVLPQAVVTVTYPGGSLPPVTADESGYFVVNNVPAGAVLVSATKASDTSSATHGIAYSTADVVATVTGGQPTSVTPVVHEGCFQEVDLASGGADAGAVDAGAFGDVTMAACGITGAWAHVHFDATSFGETTGGSPYGGTIRIEMIPLAYPVTATTPDLSWASGIPGITPLGTVGAVEYRVYEQATGTPLVPRSGAPLSLDVPVCSSVSPAAASSYSTASGWSAASGITPGPLAEGPNDIVQWMTLQGVTTFGWWSIASGATLQTSCARGVVQVNGVPTGGITVRAVGSNYLGTSTATSASDGTGVFCVDLPKTGLDSSGNNSGVAQGTLSARQATANGTMYASSPTAASFQVSVGAPGTCATGNCTTLNPINLLAAESCITVTLDAADGGVIPSLVNVEVQENDGNTQLISAAQIAAGISPNAYVGQANASPTTGIVCTTVPGANNVIFTSTANPGCSSSPVMAPAASDTCAGAGTGACGPSNGTASYGCP